MGEKPAVFSTPCPSPHFSPEVPVFCPEPLFPAEPMCLAPAHPTLPPEQAGLLRSVGPWQLPLVLELLRPLTPSTPHWTLPESPLLIRFLGRACLCGPGRAWINALAASSSRHCLSSACDWPRPRVHEASLVAAEPFLAVTSVPTLCNMSPLLPRPGPGSLGCDILTRDWSSLCSPLAGAIVRCQRLPCFSLLSVWRLRISSLCLLQILLLGSAPLTGTHSGAWGPGRPARVLTKRADLSLAGLGPRSS